MGLSHDPLTNAQIEHVCGLGSEERANFMAAWRDDLQSHRELMSLAARPHEEVICGLMPRASALATGAASGFATHALMEGIDPEHRLHPVGSEGIEGAVSGAMGAGMMTVLGGSAALVGPEVLPPNPPPRKRWLAVPGVTRPEEPEHEAGGEELARDEMSPVDEVRLAPPRVMYV